MAVAKGERLLVNAHDGNSFCKETQRKCEEWIPGHSANNLCVRFYQFTTDIHEVGMLPLVSRSVD